MYNYQKTNRYFAQVADDLKDIAEKEILSLGGHNTRQVYRGIYFNSTPEVLYTINFESRLIHRVLAPLILFDCHSDRYLYKVSSQIEWQDFLDVSQTFAVSATVSHSAIKHSKFAALRLKDAIVDYFRLHKGERPSVSRKNPDLWINLHIENNKATVSLDTSGGSLHKRGYRKETVLAPMIETLAAAIIKYSGWDASVPLYDPFCGAGTLLCEGYMLASRTPAAITRANFGFQRLPDFDPLLWEQVKQKGLQKRIELSKNTIAGSDLCLRTVKSATHNCSIIDEENVINIEQKDVFDIPSIEGKTIVCNPPYGIRTGKDVDLGDFYKRFGDFLKRRCCGSTAYVYFGQRKYIKNLGLKPSWRKQLSNGGLDGRLVMYELY